MRKQRLLDALSLYKLFTEADGVEQWINEKEKMLVTMVPGKHTLSKGGRGVNRGVHVFHWGDFCNFGRRIFASFVSYTANFFGGGAVASPMPPCATPPVKWIYISCHPVMTPYTSLDNMHSVNCNITGCSTTILIFWAIILIFRSYLKFFLWSDF